MISSLLYVVFFIPLWFFCLIRLIITGKSMWIWNDIQLSKDIREKTIIANITRRRCNYLFGTDYKPIALEE